MSDFLKTMAEKSADRAEAAKGSVRSADLDRPIVALDLSTFDVIAELKSRSPSEGAIANASSSISKRAARYADAGAAAISVLTEPTQFAGDITDLDEVVGAAGSVPVMRKDFLVDPVQVLEARAAGASGVLVIVTMLSDEQIRAMLNCAYEHSMFVVLEYIEGGTLKQKVKHK
ncbi:MAG: indole-3-glycerol-phosphate synthase TrpC, partial [Woeseia sp.]